MFAVIRTGGKQYKVSQGDVIRVEKLDGAAGDQIQFEDVLMLGGGDSDAQVGTPLVDGASVAAEILEQTRAAKITVFKKKRRKNYRRKKGHRQHLTCLRVTDILTGGAKPKAKKAEKPAKKEAAPKTEAKAAAAPAALFATPEGPADDLKKISGVGPVLEKKLNALGITTFAQVAAFSPEDIAKVDDALSFKGRIDRDDWLSQASKLAGEAK